MWIWEKKITQNDESQWAEKLSGVVGVVFTTLPDFEKSLVQCYCEEAASAAALLTAFGGKMSKLEDRDWVAATAPENSPPLLIRNRLVIVSSPSQVKPMQQRYPKRQVLYFPAERAFGTGNHGTTATCLRMLCDEAHSRRKRDWRIIDVGCGSGILGVAALRLGAKQAICFDFDAAAVEVARRNVERNGCPPACMYSKRMFLNGCRTNPSALKLWWPTSFPVCFSKRFLGCAATCRAVPRAYLSFQAFCASKSMTPYPPPEKGDFPCFNGRSVVSGYL